jgi:hypothetical protein
VYLPYDYTTGNVLVQAARWLSEHGLDPAMEAYNDTGYVVLCTTFQRLDGKPRGY